MIFYRITWKEMIAKELINHMIPPLKFTDKGHKAVTWMEELRLDQLPVVDEGLYMGLISEDIILDSNDISKTISEFPLIAEKCFVHDYQYFYDILKLSSDFNVQIVAVLNDFNQFLGVISVEDTLTAFAQTAAVQSPGGVLVLSLNAVDYSLSEISRLIESNNAKILSCSIKTDISEPSKVRLTIKINKEDLSHIIATLERFGYKIIARFQETQTLTNEKERLDILLKYLDI